MPRDYSESEALDALRNIHSRANIATLLDTTPKRINYHLYPKPKGYRAFSIPKKGGGERRIIAPSKPIAGWQHQIANLLRDAYRPRAAAHGFCLGRSIVTNAEIHKGNRWVLNIDLSDFFGSIHFGRVRGLFSSHPFSIPRNVAAILAQLCCHDGKLAQGAPSSPIISNWVCRSLDGDLSKLARKYRCRYSRYADDITFSSQRRTIGSGLVAEHDGSSVTLGSELRSIIEGHGFRINDGKVWLRGRSHRQEVTGIIVNERTNVRREFLRELRAALHAWKVKGYSIANADFQARYSSKNGKTNKPSELADWLRGRLAFLTQVRGADDALTVYYRHEYALLSQIIGKGSLKASIVNIQKLGPTNRRALKLALWIVEVIDINNDLLNHGTAFAIEGYGLITSHHVVEDVESDQGARILIRPAYKCQEKYEAKVHASNTHLDLAILETDAPVTTCLKRCDSRPPIDGAIILAGFAHWNTCADTMWAQTGKVAHHRILNTVNYTLVDVGIRSGASGGPGLYEGKVFGIITWGSANSALPNCLVSADHLNQI